MLTQLLIFFGALVAVWIGSGLTVGAVNRFAAHLKISAFALSFTVLGLLTSIPEFSVGLNAVIEDRPDVFIGNLIGASAAIFFFVIPLVAVIGRGVKLNNGFRTPQLGLSLAVVLAPALLSADSKITPAEGAIMLMLYLLLSAVLPTSAGFFSRIRQQARWFLFSRSLVDLTQLIAGVILVFAASRYLVESTIGLAGRFHIPALILSMFALSIGTNIPELALGIRSILVGRKDIAFGDYVGSAAANTLFFGFFVLFTGWTIVLPPLFWMTTVLVAVGYSLFWYLASTHKELSRREGIIMLGLYGAFLAIQFLG